MSSPEAGIGRSTGPPVSSPDQRQGRRFNLTLKWEWAYARAYESNASRTPELDRWLHHHNYHRPHMAHEGRRADHRL